MEKPDKEQLEEQTVVRVPLLSMMCHSGAELFLSSFPEPAPVISLPGALCVVMIESGPIFPAHS